MTTAEVAPLRFAANLKWLFTELPLEERFAAAAEQGFRGVEYPTPYEHSIQAMSRMLADAGVELTLINTPAHTASGRTVTGIACDPALRTEFRAGLERGLEYAAGLGVDRLHVVGGSVPAEVTAERAWGEYLLNIAWASELAAEAGVTLLIEAQNHRSSPGFVLTTQAQAANVVDIVGSEHLRMLFDVFHVQVQEGDVTRRLLEFAPLIGHIQIADAPARTEPGSGELAWGHIFRSVAEIGYDGWIGCEYTATAPDRASVAWLERIGARDVA